MATTATKTYQLYLNGQWQDAAGGKTFPVHNPATGELLAEVADGGVAETEAAIKAAVDAFPAWSKRPADERAELLHKTFDILKSRIQVHARILTEENGKPLAESVGEATWSRSVRSLARGGRLITCGATTGGNGSLDLRALFAKQLTVRGSYMGTKGELLAVARLFFDGLLAPIVDRIYPLAEAAAAQIRLEESAQFGKIVLDI